MKKLTALILTLVMLVSMTAIVPVSAATPVITPSITTGEITAGERITITFALNEDFDFYASNFKIDLDQSVFTLPAAGALQVLSGTTTSYYDEEAWEDKTIFTVSKNVTMPGFYAFLIEPQTATNISTLAKTYGTYKPEKYASITLDVAADAKAGTYDLVYTIGFTDDDRTPYPNIVDTIKLTIPGAEEEPTVDSANIKTNEFQFRTSGDFGFRFVSTIKGYEGAEYGTLVIPSDLLGVGEELTTETTDVADVPAVNFMSEEGAEEVKFNATLVGIEGNNNAIYREYAVRAYAIVDGEITYGETVTCTINEQLQSAIASVDAATAEYLQGILDAAN